MGKNNALACIVALGACIVAPSSAFASPMDPDERYVVVNDGDSLVLQDIGDEYYSVSRTEDGFLVVAGSRGVLYYADENGEPSKFKARSLRKRSGAEKAFLNGIDRDRAFRAHRKKVPDRTEFDVGQRESRAPWVPTLQAPKPSVLPASFHSNGNLRFPIILVAGEADNRKNLDSAGMYARLNQENYTEDSYLGSVRDYFVDQSSGLFVPQFDLFLVSESEAFENYVGKESELMSRAILSMLEKYPSFDPSLYDSDDDGEIDAFGVMYAGERYHSKANSSKHLGGFQTTLKKYKATVDAGDGTIFNTCFIIDQGGSHVVQLIHEFSHTMGLMDHYCVRFTTCKDNYADSAFQAPGAHAWDVMSTGMYNGNYRKPPNYSAFERNFMGWLDYTTLEVDSQVKAVPPLGTNNFAYYVNVNENEWYIFENRQQVKWDSGLPNHGMLVWHIDYDATAWKMDVLNDNGPHQRVDIIEAGTLKVLSQTGGYMSQGGGTRQKDDPFPGSQNVTKLSPVLAWDSSVVLPGLFNIAEPDTNVCFALDSNIVVDGCVFVPPSSSSALPESSSSSETPSSSSMASSSSEAPVSSGSATRSSSSAVKSSSSVANSSSSAAKSSSSTVSSSSAESSSSTTLVRGGAVNAPGFHVMVDGNMLFVTAPGTGITTLRIFDMQGHALLSTRFAGRALHLNLGYLAQGTPLVVRLESERGTAGHFRILPTNPAK